MFSWHGWAVIQTSAGSEDLAHDPDQATIDAVTAIVDAGHGNFNEVIGLSNLNGSLQLWMIGAHNHRSEQPTALFRAIGEAAPGSYGLLYVADDEAPDCGNAFVAWVMRKGSIDVESDPFLSPRRWTIEDPLTED